MSKRNVVGFVLMLALAGLFLLTIRRFPQWTPIVQLGVYLGFGFALAIMFFPMLQDLKSDLKIRHFIIISFVCIAVIEMGVWGFPEWRLPTGVSAAIIVLVTLLWLGPKLQVASLKLENPKEKFDCENEARKTVAQVMGGALLIVGVYSTWQNLKTTQESVRIASEGEIADRFTKAIEQLGAVNANGTSKLELRLGGIFALERIANDSEKDHWPIMEILTAYVRQNAPRRPSPKQGEPAPPALDIQSILTVIGRRTLTDSEHQRHQRLDLTWTQLSKAELINAKLAYADLRDADLRSADLRGADLKGVLSDGSELAGANLQRSKGLTQSQLDKANGDEETEIPDGLQRPKHWVGKKSQQASRSKQPKNK
jgi:Pentapeptide repeats (8 copies)